MGSEETPQKTVVDGRWDNRAEEFEAYDLIFDVAIAMTRHKEFQLVAALLFAVINEYEQNRRSVPDSVIKAALALSNEYLALPEYLEFSHMLKEICGDGTVV